MTVATLPPAASDSFGRVRVSQPAVVFDTNFYTGLQPYEWAALQTGAAAVAWVQGNPGVELSSSGAGRVVRQTRRYIPYSPGKSHLALLTGSLATAAPAASPNSTSRIGLFDDAADVTVGGATAASAGNGFFFELAGAALSVVARTRVSQPTGALLPAQADTKVAQAAWNIDRLDGKGASGYTLDPAQRQVFAFGIGWLGTNDVYLGVVAQCRIFWAHRFAFAGGTPGGGAAVGAYNARGSLPARYELASTAAPARSLIQVCTSVVCEGGFEPDAPRARILSLSNLRVGITVAATEVVLLAVRLKTGRVRATLTPLAFGATSTVTASHLLRLYRFIAPAAYGTDAALLGNGGAWLTANALTAAGFTDAASGGVSVAQVNTTAGAAGVALDTSGAVFPFVRLGEAYMSGTLGATASVFSDRVNTLASDPGGNSDYLVLSAVNATSAAPATLFASLRWLEYE